MTSPVKAQRHVNTYKKCFIKLLAMLRILSMVTNKLFKFCQKLAMCELSLTCIFMARNKPAGKPDEFPDIYFQCRK